MEHLKQFVANHNAGHSIQAKSELESPLVPEIEAVLAERIPVISQFALHEFQSIVSIVGGPQEKERASSWLSRVRYISSPLELCCPYFAPYNFLLT